MCFLRGLTLRFLLCFMLMSFLSTHVQGKELDSAQNTAENLYRVYLNANHLKASDRLIHAYFSKDLAAFYVQQMKKDAALHEVGCINDFDVLTGSQEQPLGFKIRPLSQKGQNAQVSVRFDFGAPLYTQVKLLMRFEQGHWVIDDLMYLDIGQSLRQMIVACQLA